MDEGVEVGVAPLHLDLFPPLPPLASSSSPSLLLFPASTCWVWAGDGAIAGVGGGRLDPSTLIRPGTTPATFLAVAEIDFRVWNWMGVLESKIFSRG